MNRNLATTLLFAGALTIPAFGLAAGTDMKTTADQPKTTAGQWVKDSVITTKIKAEMVKDPAVSAAAIKVDTDANGVVQLSGTAKSQSEIDKAVQIAQATRGVSKVDNKITLAK